MESRKLKVCFNSTTLCNQKCKMCIRENGTRELTPEEATRVVDNIAMGTGSLTFSGGEFLIRPDSEKMLKEAKARNITTGIISNGIALTEEKQAKVLPYCDKLTLSLDSCNDVINERMGRGFDQRIRVEKLLKNMEEFYPNIPVKINTVVTKLNLAGMADLTRFVNGNPAIKRWKIFMFADFRGVAAMNREFLAITEKEFSYVKDIVRLTVSRPNLECILVDNHQIEDEYLIVRPDGMLVVTRNKKDVILGSLLDHDIRTLLECG